MNSCSNRFSYINDRAMKKVKVLQLIAPTEFGGAERIVLDIADVIDKSRFHLVIGSFVNKKRPENKFVQILNEKNLSNVIFWLKRTIDITNIFKIAALIRRKEIRLIHSHGYRADILGLIAAKLTRRPIVSTVHGWIPIDTKLKFYEQCNKIALRGFDRVISVSKEIREALVTAGVNQSKIRCLHNAVNVTVEQFNSGNANPFGFVKREGDLVIGAVGRLSPEKDIGNFIECASLLAREFENISFVIVGDGPERKALERLSSDLGMADRIRFTGFIREMERVYNTLDILVISSHTEGVPLAMLEAMKYSIPVVATDVGGIGEVIRNGENGFIVRPGNPGELAKYVGLVIKEKGLFETLSAKARERIEKAFNRDIWIKQIEKVYMDCVSMV